MVHLEVCCQICGVSFNIGRYPTKSEVTAGLSDTRWLQNTQVLRAQVQGACDKDCFLGSLKEKTSASDDSKTSYRQLFAESLKPMSKVKGRRYTSDEQHVAGPACSKLGGYNGNSISPQEIRGSCSLQCLVPKPRPRRLLFSSITAGEQPQAGKDFYLTGLADSISQGYVQGAYPPEWHLHALLIAKNRFTNADDVEKAAMPFHPTCLEVYKRASMHRLGVIDIQGLRDWYRLEGSDEECYRKFPRHPRVTKAQVYWQNGRDQLWLHHRGSEFLAANPCFVPALPSILDSVVNSESSLVDSYCAAQVSSSQIQKSDFLSRLPMEIRLHVAGYLGATDVANIRLVSRGFHDLPQYFFRQFILREYPWLWETWCDLPYSIYAGIERGELKTGDSRWKTRRMFLDKEIIALREKVAAGGNSEQELPKINALKDCLAKEEAAYKKTRDPIPAYILPSGTSGVDWYRLYRDLSLNFDNLKGLRNRRRIWKDCGEILDRIEKYRVEGRMRPAPTRT